MYNNFFGFREGPFQLVPNPEYLFLSRSHEETMANLNYAIYQGEGFVEITGEVGTGKTTLCRAFLEKIEKETEAAYIFNPKLDPIQLLKAINDEFGIGSDKNTIKELIDTLNAFLMKQKASGKNVVLIVDEAQNLSNEVLEQLRLLSNLETNKSKLLQIIMVGQPELKDMLDSHELRQLGQRINVSSHLLPLTAKETIEYIQHRIHIASRKPGTKFTRLAFYFIYKFSRGIPRLINILCDRSLLTAYSLDQHQITAGIVRSSIKELTGRGFVKHYSFWEGKNALLVILLLCIALVVVTFYRPGTDDISVSTVKQEKRILEKSDENAVRKKILHPVASKEKQPVIPGKSFLDRPPDSKASGSKQIDNLGAYLKSAQTRSSRSMALKAAFSLWNTSTAIKPHLDELEDDLAFFKLAAKEKSLLIHRIKGNLKGVKKLNLPAILELSAPDISLPRYLAIQKMDDGLVTFKVKDSLIVVKPDEIKKYWSGRAYILWKNLFSYQGTIPLTSPKDSIIALKMHLHDMGYDQIKINSVYDDQTKAAVKNIQKKYGLKADGLVGPLTKIVLYNEKKSLNIPNITN
ncbi:MAG: AAA family ATPase [Thermodesulfobacteriota bacterium]|nr:AAA family ATPase [Thermodesulfobacteriota bacterium]